MLPRLALIFAAAVLVSPGVTRAQTTAAPQPAVETQQFDAPAYVSVVDGAATIERDGRIENAPLNMPLLGGDRLRTADGRVEVRFADGGRLALDARTSLDVLSEELVRLGDGRIRLSVQRAQQVSYRVDSAVGSVRITQPGEYRIALIQAERETQLEFAVIRGGGEIVTDQGSTPVRSGERAYASQGLLPSYAYAFNSATLDEFDRWAEMQRGTVYAATSESSQYLPSDMGGYASTFDQYGDWRYQQSYGYVWYPRVANEWRPYYYGRWTPYPAYGWTWITADPFGYPTHHYGRWGFSAGAWFWIPSRHWGPAYVSWAYTPSYVSWCPLGWNNAAVFSIGFYNVGPNYYAGHYRGHYYAAWTTVPHGAFGRGRYAHQDAVNWDRPGYNGARARFSESTTPPPTGDYAVPRNGAPVRYAGTRAVSASAAVSGSRSLQPGVDTAHVRAGASPSSAPPAAGRTPSPRYINRGEQIVRSQTERPTPPRTAPLSGTADSTFMDRAAVARENRGGDRPSSRSGAAPGDATSRTYDRAVARTQDADVSPRQEPSRTVAPRSESRSDAPRTYTNPYAGDRVYRQPYAGDRPSGQPSQGDRAYERPAVTERTYQQPYAGRAESGRSVERAAPAPPPAPMPSARPTERSMPAPRSVERAAPAPPPAPAPSARPSGGQGGDRAVPRSGGASSPRGGGRSR